MKKINNENNAGMISYEEVTINQCPCCKYEQQHYRCHKL